MSLGTTILFYLLLGAGVTCADFLSESRTTGQWPLVRSATAWLFWPFYVPLLLARPKPTKTPTASKLPQATADGMSDAIEQVERELASALASLDGWAEDVLSHEEPRLEELRSAWRAQAERIREMDQVLARPEFARPSPSRANEPAFAGDRWRQSEEARQAHVERLREVRRQAYVDLMETLAWVRELVTMIHLAKFTGAPASRAAELVAQIAAAVEGLAEVTSWKEVAAR
jgi:hypothetical protein